MYKMLISHPNSSEPYEAVGADRKDCLSLFFKNHPKSDYKILYEGPVG